MRRFRLGLTSISSLVLMTVAPAALAGNCGTYGTQNCDPGVVYNASGAPSFDPLSVNINQPLHGLRSVHIHSAPQVSITRLYGQQTLASLGDRPSGFQGGCHPTTTQYCRSDAGVPVNVALSRPQVQAPVIAAPVSVVSPIVTPQVRFGSGYNPAAFQSRQYGENVFTPGIAHVPTSYVDRSPHTAERLLRSGLTRSYNTASYNSSSFSAASPYAGGSVQITQPSFSTHTTVPTGNTTPIEADGRYWEQVSGPTLFGDTLATQVVCRRQAPVAQPIQVQRQIIRPVIAAPAPVYCEPSRVTSRYGFSSGSVQAPSVQFQGFQQGLNSGYGQSYNSGFGQGRWTY